MFLIDETTSCDIKKILLYPHIMKKNAFTLVCALLTLVACMVLGAIFGANDFTGSDQQDEVRKAVASGRN